MQIKTIMKYHFTSTRVAMKKKEEISTIGKCVRELEPLYVAGGNVK